MSKQVSLKPDRQAGNRRALEVASGSPAQHLSGFPRSVKRMISHQIERELIKQGLSRAELALRLGTSRAAVNRLLDPENRSVTLQTLEKVAELLNKNLLVFIKE